MTRKPASLHGTSIWNPTKKKRFFSDTALNSPKAKGWSRSKDDYSIVKVGVKCFGLFFLSLKYLGSWNQGRCLFDIYFYLFCLLLPYLSEWFHEYDLALRCIHLNLNSYLAWFPVILSIPNLQSLLFQIKSFVHQQPLQKNILFLWCKLSQNMSLASSNPNFASWQIHFDIYLYILIPIELIFLSNVLTIQHLYILNKPIVKNISCFILFENHNLTEMSFRSTLFNLFYLWEF